MPQYELCILSTAAVLFFFCFFLPQLRHQSEGKQDSSLQTLNCSCPRLSQFIKNIIYNLLCFFDVVIVKNMVLSYWMVRQKMRRSYKWKNDDDLDQIRIWIARSVVNNALIYTTIGNLSSISRFIFKMFKWTKKLSNSSECLVFGEELFRKRLSLD